MTKAPLLVERGWGEAVHKGHSYKYKNLKKDLVVYVKYITFVAELITKSSNEPFLFYIFLLLLLL